MVSDLKCVVVTAISTACGAVLAMTAKTSSADEPTTFEDALEKTGNGVYNILLVMVCSFSLLAIGVDLFGFSLVVAAACDLDLTVRQKGILTSLPFIGILLVSYMWGYFADTRGRRYTLVVPLQISFVLSCIGSLSPHWLFLAFMKFFCVCFACAANSSTYTLVGESCIQRVKGKYMVLMTCLIILSPAVAGVLAYPTLKLNFALEIYWLGIVFRPWRLLIIVLALPCGISGALIYFFHESPKFLFNSGRKDEALDVLKHIYAVNNKCAMDEFKVNSLKCEEQNQKKETSLVRAIYEQSAPLFRPPYLMRSLQLFYIVAVAYITNNSFLVWLPHILNLVKISLDNNATDPGNICTLISTEPLDATNPTANGTSAEVCTGAIAQNVMLTLIASQCLFAFFNFIISYLPHRRRTVLITILCISAISGSALNLVPEPVSSVVFFMAFTCTCLGMGILASYFVDLYPTSFRGMVACLSIMVGRSSAFIGINVVGNLLFHHCEATFYAWSLLVFSSAVASWFLPPDKPTVQPASNKAVNV